MIVTDMIPIEYGSGIYIYIQMNMAVVKVAAAGAVLAMFAICFIQIRRCR